MALCVSDIMERNVKSIHCQSSIAAAEEMLVTNRFTGAPMVSTDGQILGVVSMTDIVRFRYDHSEENPHSRMVYEIGTPVPITVEGKASLCEASKLLVENQIHRLVVVDAGVPVGILTTLDIIEQVARLEP
jgi:predicted transcriptional regulator